LIAVGYEENKPQINADERGFVASNPAHLIGSWDLVHLLFLSFSLVVLLQRISAWDSMVLVLLFFKNRSIKSAFIRVHLRLNFSKAEYSNSCMRWIAPHPYTVYVMFSI
jgi:hypothetical protein